MGFDNDAGTYVSCSYRVDPHDSQERERRPVTHCEAFSKDVGSDGSLMAAASNMITFGLLHMLASGPQDFPRGKLFSTFRMIKVMRQCLHALDMWKKLWFLSQGPVLGAPCHSIMLMTDNSQTCWGVVMSGRSAQGQWEGIHLRWHINCQEILAVFKALKNVIPDLRGQHVLLRTDNTSTCDLAVLLGALLKAPFKPLEEVPLRFITVKTVFLLAISSLKRASDLQALTVAPSCLKFALGMGRVFLHPRPG